jgi:drug/metabolite transporter (DMT)-like permease
MSAQTSRPGLAWLLLIVLTVIWGSSFILMLKGLEGFDALQLALSRMGIAAICMTPFLFRYAPQLTARDWGMLFIVGMTGNGIPAYLFAQSETFLPTAVVGVLNSMSPIWTLVIGYLFFQLRFPWINGVGVLVGVVGASILALAGKGHSSAEQNLNYSLLVVIATVCYGINTNLLKRYFAGRDPIMIATVALSTVGWPSIVVLLTCTDFMHRMQANPAAPSALGYIAILAAVGTALGVALFNRLLQISNIIFATSVTYLIPIVAVIWGLILEESFTELHLLGFAIILAGVWLANRK